MPTTENEYYIRAILLLAEGGSYISKKVLYRELSVDLNKLLKGFERELKHELHEKQIEKLFPRTGNTIVDTWDLQMLIIVVLRLFHNSLKREDKRNLRVLKSLRNEVQAHSPSVTLDVVQYEDINDQLTDALTCLASGFEENVQEECRLYINKYTSGPLDVMSAKECLKQLQNNDVLFKQVLEEVESSKNDICTRLNDLEKNLTEKLQRLDPGTYRTKIKVGMHVELSLGGPTKEWILLMESTLNDVFNEAYKTSGGKFEDIKKRVEELLEDIKQNTTINFKGSTTMCIILMFECFTYSGLLDLLQYLTSQKYRSRLGALTEALSTHFKVDIPVTATSTISPECLQNALDDLAEREKEKEETENCHNHPSVESMKSLKLAMECSSGEDLVYLWEMFQQGGAAHYLDRIADKLSEYSGEKITLSSSLNLEEFKEALEDTVGGVADAESERSKITVGSDDAEVERSKITVGSDDTEGRRSKITVGSDDAEVERSKITEYTKHPFDRDETYERKYADEWPEKFEQHLTEDDISDYDEHVSKQPPTTCSRQVKYGKNALHKSPKMYICNYDRFPVSQGYISPANVIGNLSSLKVGAGAIQNVYVYRYPLTPFSSLNFWLYHMLIVFKTETRWWSIERTEDGITIQTSKYIYDLLRLYRNTERRYFGILEKDARGCKSVS